MRLILDMQACQSAAHADRGIARYVQEHAAALVQGFGDRIAAVVLNPTLPAPATLIPELEFGTEIGWNTASLLRSIAKEGPVAYHLMSPIELAPTALSLVPPHVVRAGIPLLSTLYDLIPLRHPERYLVHPQTRTRYRQRVEIYRHCDHVFAISEHARQDAIELLGIDERRITNIGGGVSRQYRTALAADVATTLLEDALPSIDRPFVFATLGCDDRKNAEGLIRAYALLPDDLRARHQLVIACALSPGFGEKWRNEASAAGLDEHELVLTDFVSDQVLRALYARSALFAFPSLYEGFGLPPAEAMAHGIPTIVSNRSSLPEVVGWEPATFDPTNDAEFASCLQRALTDEDFRRQLRANGERMSEVHTWDNVAQRSIKVFDRALAARSITTRVQVQERRDRIALVGPMPPVASGIADYNARVARELALRCDLDIVAVGAQGRRGMPSIAGASILSTTQFAEIANPHSYDGIVYTLGNSEHHHDTLPLVRRFPGWVWLHDIRIVNLFGTLATAGYPGAEDEFVLDVLDDIYHGQHRLHGETGIDAFRLHTSGMYLSAGVVRSSRGALTNSEIAARMLRRECGPSVRGHIDVLPFGVPHGEFPRLDTNEDVGFVTLGIVAHVKLPLALIDALASVDDPRARLTFVGDAEPNVAKDIERHARRRGVHDRITVTGRVDDEAYARYVASSVGGIQLRAHSNGESSAAVADLLAAGVPVATNVAAFNEVRHGLLTNTGHAVDVDAIAAWMRQTLTGGHASGDVTMHSQGVAPFSDVAEALLDVVRRRGASAGGNAPRR